MERPELEQTQRSTAAEALLDLSTSCRAQDNRDNVQNTQTQAVPVAENSRERLRPWLITMIDSGAIPGLDWLNPEKTKFKIPWKHAGKHEYNQDRDSLLFKEWAKYTGKYREDVDKPEPAVWKTRLRCALNKHPKIHEVKNESQPEDFHNPYKVYVFQDRTDEKISTKRVMPGGRLTGPGLESYETAESPVTSYAINPTNERIGSKRPLVTAGHLILTSADTANSCTPEPITQRTVAIVTRWRGTPEPEDSMNIVNKTIRIEAQHDASTNTSGFIRTAQVDPTPVKNTRLADPPASVSPFMGRMFFKITKPQPPPAQTPMVVDPAQIKSETQENASPNTTAFVAPRHIASGKQEDMATNLGTLPAKRVDLAPKLVASPEKRFVQSEIVKDPSTSVSAVKVEIPVKTETPEYSLADKPNVVEQRQIEVKQEDEAPTHTATPMEQANVKSEFPKATSELSARLATGQGVKVEVQDASMEQADAESEFPKATSKLAEMARFAAGQAVKVEVQDASMEQADVESEFPKVTSEHTTTFTVGRCVKVEIQGDGSSNNSVLTDQRQLGNLPQERREIISFRQEPLVRQEPSPVNGQKINVCPLCGDRTASVQEFDAHMRAHRWEKPFMCGECGFRTGTKTALSKHMKTHFPTQHT